jgi:hypothetical protein
MPTVTERLTDLLAHRRTGITESDAILDALIGAFGDALERVGLVAFGDETVSGVRYLRDPSVAHAWALRHAAMYVGAFLPGRAAGETEEAWLARARDAAVYPLGMKRGSHEAILRAVRPLLTGSKSVFITDTGGDPYEIQVRTVTSETPDPAAVQAAIEGDYVSGGRRGAIRAELVLDYVVSDVPTFAEATLRFDEVADGVTAENVTREDVT